MEYMKCKSRGDFKNIKKENLVNLKSGLELVLYNWADLVRRKTR